MPRDENSSPCRWYKYGRRQRRIFFGYTAFAGLGLLFLAMIVGFIMYGMHSGKSEPAGNLGASAKGFMVSAPDRQDGMRQSLCALGEAIDGLFLSFPLRRSRVFGTHILHACRGSGRTLSVQISQSTRSAHGRACDCQEQWCLCCTI